ncbi:Uncharacterised protein [Kluyvera cryocrescens]|uniref:Uncharacterized protein n=1 Tax=Kluyvera cryocrescens TaxID=580 RepID=A0A485A9T3_KLUCR|nr:Uncharacterised protein [Kluyvera cryocrescens]
MLLKFPLQRFLIYITITLIGTLVLNHFSNSVIRHVPAIAPILFPTLTIFSDGLPYHDRCVYGDEIYLR